MAAKKKSSKSKSTTRKKSSASKTRRTKSAASRKPARKPAKKAASKKAPAKKAARRKANASAGDRVEEVQRVIDVMVERGAVEVELEEPGFKMRVRLKEEQAATVVSVPQASFSQPTVAPAAASASAAAPAPAPAANGEVFTSPMVGTYYSSPSPDASAFVDVGDRVAEGSTLCILEAMKVMNEIQAEQSGTITEILVKNGDPVEYGQPLFVIDAD